jgi:hypothetical protein
LVKFTSPIEFYDWYDANRAEILAFKEAHDSSIGLGNYVYSSDRIGQEPLPPRGPWREKHKYWSHFDRGDAQKEVVLQEDEIYIVANVGYWSKRRQQWWVIYIPIPLYKVNNSISTPFRKEAWWYYREDDIGFGAEVAPDLKWISGFIKYGGESPRRRLTFNYPIGGI